MYENFECIPTDILLHVFSYFSLDSLRSAACVNKEWHGMIYTREGLWFPVIHISLPENELQFDDTSNNNEHQNISISSTTNNNDNNNNNNNTQLNDNNDNNISPSSFISSPTTPSHIIQQKYIPQRQRSIHRILNANQTSHRHLHCLYNIAKHRFYSRYRRQRIQQRRHAIREWLLFLSLSAQLLLTTLAVLMLFLFIDTATDISWESFFSFQMVLFLLETVFLFPASFLLFPSWETAVVFTEYASIVPLTMAAGVSASILEHRGYLPSFPRFTLCAMPIVISTGILFTARLVYLIRQHRIPSTDTRRAPSGDHPRTPSNGDESFANDINIFLRDMDATPSTAMRNNTTTDVDRDDHHIDHGDNVEDRHINCECDSNYDCYHYRYRYSYTEYLSPESRSFRSSSIPSLSRRSRVFTPEYQTRLFKEMLGWIPMLGVLILLVLISVKIDHRSDLSWTASVVSPIIFVIVLFNTVLFTFHRLSRRYPSLRSIHHRLIISVFYWHVNIIQISIAAILVTSGVMFGTSMDGTSSIAVRWSAVPPIIVMFGTAFAMPMKAVASCHAKYFDQSLEKKDRNRSTQHPDDVFLDVLDPNDIHPREREQLRRYGMIRIRPRAIFEELGLEWISSGERS